MLGTWKRIKTAIREGELPWMRILVFVVGLLWLNSALHKLLDPGYVGGFAGTMSFFALQNPNQWYADFLTGFVVPNAVAFAWAIVIGQLLVALSFIFGGLTRIGAIGGILLSVNFFFAAGHLSPSTWSINLLLIALQVVFLLSREAKALSVDQLIQAKLTKRFKASGKKALEIFLGAPSFSVAAKGSESRRILQSARPGKDY